MKNWFVIPLAAVAGMIAGSWGPRADLAALESLKAERAVKSEINRKSGFRAIADLAHIPDRAKGRRLKDEDGNTVKSGGTKIAGQEGEGTNAISRPKPPHGMMMRMNRADLKARIEEAKELWQTRCELARTQWKAKLGVKDGDAGSFDRVLDDMNAELTDLMREFTEEIEQSRTLSAELGVKMMSAVTRTLSESYDALGECVDEGRRTEVSNLPIHEFIDPSVLEPMVTVQDYLEPPEER